MHYDAFFKCLDELKPSPRVEIETLRKIVDDRHNGVGKVLFKYFPDFEGSQWGNFVWLEEERTSPHEDPFRDAVVFINSKFSGPDNRPMRRIIGAKELMHVFDTDEQRASDPDKFRRLLREIASRPITGDTSEPYDADRIALWKAILALVPPWIRQEYLEPFRENAIKAHELAARWWLPENIASAAMGEYYDRMAERFKILN